MCVCLKEVLLHPDRLLLLLQYSVFDDLDEVLRPRPGVVVPDAALFRSSLHPAHGYIGDSQSK